VDRHSAFAHLGAAGIVRQWHLKASDGVEVVSIWEHLIVGEVAEAHVHKKYFKDFQVGMNVRAVIQRGIFEPESGNMRTKDSEPDPTGWTVVLKEVRPLENKWIKELHVVKLRKAVKAGA